MKEICVGIDFGTTKTIVSYYIEDTGEIKVIHLGRGREDVPSSVYALGNEGFLFGDEADDMLVDSPERYCRAFKMKLGSNDPQILYVGDNDEIVSYTAHELTAAFLRHILTECERMLGCRIRRAVITRPVCFEPGQQEKLKQAACEAGLSEVEFITEPEAAARMFCFHYPDKAFKHALVLDWGGGTLDMAIVSHNDGVMETNRRYVCGMPKGGEHFDEKLQELVIEHMREKHNRGDELKTDISNPLYAYTIRRMVRSAKEKLSQKQKESCIMRISGANGLYPAVEILKQEFEQAIQPELDEAADMAMKLIEDAKRDKKKAQRVILVGGSSCIPVVAETIKKRTGLSCIPWDRRIEAVGMGAAMVAAELWCKKPQPRSEKEVIDNKESKPPRNRFGWVKSLWRGVRWLMKKIFRLIVVLLKISVVLGIAYVLLGRFAYKWYAYLSDDAKMMMKIGHMYQYGNCNPPRFSWKKGLSTMGNGYYENHPHDEKPENAFFYVPSDTDEAAKWYGKAAKLGNVHAKYHYGVSLLYGANDVHKDPVLAVEYLKDAQNAGCAGADYILGEYYSAKNTVFAVECWKMAARKGLVKAMCRLGDHYRHKTKVQAEARVWYKMGAEAGDAECQYKFADMLATGCGGDVNTVEAAYWFRRVMEQDDISIYRGIIIGKKPSERLSELEHP